MAKTHLYILVAYQRYGQARKADFHNSYEHEDMIQAKHEVKIR